MENNISELLSSIIYPETGRNIVESNFIDTVQCKEDSIYVRLDFRKKKEPFERSIVKQVESKLATAYPGYKLEVDVARAEEPVELVREIDYKTIVVASGKGGVGKSTVTANLARSLASSGYKVGILDADIYGPSQPFIFGVEDYSPYSDNRNGIEMIVPAQSRDIKIMSIGFFINTDDALVWRGPMATSAIKQLINQTLWEDIDYLLVDLPPGTGDIHLTVMGELNIDGAIIVTTPHSLATADVIRGIKMFDNGGDPIPVMGIINNMAWFSPADRPEDRYYIFGKKGAQELASRVGLPVIAEVPLISGKEGGGDYGSVVNKLYEDLYSELSGKMISLLNDDNISIQ